MFYYEPSLMGFRKLWLLLQILLLDQTEMLIVPRMIHQMWFVQYFLLIRFVVRLPFLLMIYGFAVVLPLPLQ